MRAERMQYSRAQSGASRPADAAQRHRRGVQVTKDVQQRLGRLGWLGWRRWLTPLRVVAAALTLMACALAIAARASAAGPAPELAGRAAPPFSLRAEVNGDVRAEMITLEAQRGHPALLLFTYSLCAHCPRETEAVAQLDATYRSRGLRVLYIDSPAEATDIVAAYALRVGVTAPILLDPGGRTAATYGIRAYPAAVLIGADGVVRAQWTGETGASTLRGAIESALAAGAS
jgi:peroxiredoxin